VSASVDENQDFEAMKKGTMGHASSCCSCSGLSTGLAWEEVGMDADDGGFEGQQ
jgi:hypothetical protein